MTNRDTQQQYSQASGVCPTDAQWQSALKGEVPYDSWTDFESHLKSCSPCELTVDALTEHSDTMVRALCEQPSTKFDEKEYRLLYANLVKDARFAFAGSLLDLPMRLGNYELLKPLGHGASGSVFEALHVPLDRTVAIKLLRPDHDFDPTRVDRFMREVRAIARLDHPNLVRATDAGETEGRHFLAMEYVEGVDLSQAVAKCPPLSVANASEMIRQAAMGIGHLHQNGFVHRDIKPSNLLLTADGTVKLLDLGLVQSCETRNSNSDSALEQSEPADTHANWPMGTPDYMSPEQWQDFSRVDRRSDLYSLGCSYFKLLTGSPPFRPLPEGYSDRCAAHCEAPAPSLNTFRPDVKDEAAGLYRQLVAKDAEDRFQSTEELLAAIKPLCRGADLFQVVESVGMRPIYPKPSPFRLTRRHALLAGLGGAAIAFGLTRPKKKRTIDKGWRKLEVCSPAILAPPTDLSQSHWSQRDEQIEINANGQILLNLGQPLIEEFRFEVSLLQENWHGDAGVFFRFHQPPGDNWVPDDERLVHLFQSLVLVKENENDPSSHRLLWESHRVEKQDGVWNRKKHNLAGIRVASPSSVEPLRLQVHLGTSGFMEVSLNDRALPMTLWTLSEMGQKLASASYESMPSRLVGRLGLIASSGTSRFIEPQLAYGE